MRGRMTSRIHRMYRVSLLTALPSSVDRQSYLIAFGTGEIGGDHRITTASRVYYALNKPRIAIYRHFLVIIWHGRYRRGYSPF